MQLRAPQPGTQPRSRPRPGSRPALPHPSPTPPAPIPAPPRPIPAPPPPHPSPCLIPAPPCPIPASRSLHSPCPHPTSCPAQPPAPPFTALAPLPCPAQPRPSQPHPAPAPAPSPCPRPILPHPVPACPALALPSSAPPRPRRASYQPGGSRGAAPSDARFPPWCRWYTPPDLRGLDLVGAGCDQGQRLLHPPSGAFSLEISLAASSPSPPRGPGLLLASRTARCAPCQAAGCARGGSSAPAAAGSRCPWS